MGSYSVRIAVAPRPGATPAGARQALASRVAQFAGWFAEPEPDLRRCLLVAGADGPKPERGSVELWFHDVDATAGRLAAHWAGLYLATHGSEAAWELNRCGMEPDLEPFDLDREMHASFAWYDGAHFDLDRQARALSRASEHLDVAALPAADRARLERALERGECACSLCSAFRLDAEVEAEWLAAAASGRVHRGVMTLIRTGYHVGRRAPSPRLVASMFEAANHEHATDLVGQIARELAERLPVGERGEALEGAWRLGGAARAGALTAWVIDARDASPIDAQLRQRIVEGLGGDAPEAVALHLRGPWLAGDSEVLGALALALPRLESDYTALTAVQTIAANLDLGTLDPPARDEVAATLARPRLAKHKDLAAVRAALRALTRAAARKPGRPGQERA